MASGRGRAELTPRTASPGSTKRCYHREIWVDRPAARRERLRAERAASTDPLADFAGPLVYDGYLDAFRPADLFSGDPLDLEAIAVWEEEHGVPWDPDAEDHDNAPLTADSASYSDIVFGLSCCWLPLQPAAGVGPQYVN
jgi:hypothetical protein